MIITVKRMNLFEVPGEYYLAHCISADYALGAGIAVEFQKRFRLQQKLRQVGSGGYPECIVIGRVYNLVTKANYWNKPTYASLRMTIEHMRDHMVKNNITKLATYKLGCTRDRLQWGKVRQILEDVFSDTDVEILIAHM